MTNKKKAVIGIGCFLLIAIALYVVFYADFTSNSRPEKVLKNGMHFLQFEVPRESITFILGEDKNPLNPYYSEAFDYYANNQKDRTEYLVKTCRSLLEVRDYLEKNPPQNGKAWGLVNLVSHGNQWAGMSVAVVPDSKRSASERITEYIDNGTFQPLPDSILDEKSLLFIHGCGLGHDVELLRAIARAFGGDINYPKVRASKLFEYYTSTRNNGRPINSNRYLASAQFVYYKSDAVFSEDEIISMFENKYPNDTTDWELVLNRTSPRFPGDPYSYQFDIPIKGQCIYENEANLPDLTTEEKKLEWIMNREDIANAVRKTGIPFGDFSWKCRKVFFTDSTGSKKPGIMIKGYSSMHCVLRALIDEKTRDSFTIKPFEPALNDTAYYTEE